MAADFLVLADLNNLVGSERVVQYFDDANDGSVSDSDANVLQVLKAAEGEAYSYMLRSWSKANVIALAGEDEYFKEQVAWVAVEIASERRPEFTTEDGKGAHWAAYERAKEYFNRLSKTRVRSKGESVAGAGANLGGNLRPTETAKTATSFVFAPSEKNPSGSGGF